MRQLNTQSNVIETVGHIEPTADRITNGDMLGTLFPWKQDYTVGGKYSVAQNAGAVSPPLGYTNYLGVTSLSAYTAGASDSFGISQSIAGEQLIDLGWGTSAAKSVTLSFWVYSSLTGTFGGAIQNAALNRSYPFTYSINTVSTWEKKSITIPGDQSGTWTMTGSNIGLWVRLGLGAGATLSGTAGTWAGADYRTATGAVSVVGTNGAVFYVTGVKISQNSKSVLNALDFGVTGNGITDDAKAINNLFALAPTNSTIYFPASHTYMFGSALQLPANDNVTISGYGATFKMLPSSNCDLMVSANYPSSGGGNFMKLMGFTIDGNAVNNVGKGSTAFYGVNYGLIKDVYVHDCDGVGIFLISSSRWMVVDTRVSYSGASGFCAYNGCSDITFINCIAVSCAPGFLLEGPEVNGQSDSVNLNIICCASIDSTAGQDGIQIFNGVHGFKIIGVESSGADGRGINIYSFRTGALTTATVNKNGIIANCVLKNNDSDEGLKIWDDGNTGNYNTNILVEGNRCYDDATGTQGYGIVIQNQSDNIIVAGNDLIGNVSGSLVSGGTGTNIKISNNLGYVTENSGSSSITSGSTITHGLYTTPTSIIVTGGDATVTNPLVTAKNGTNFTVTFGGGGTKLIYWKAELR